MFTSLPFPSPHLTFTSLSEPLHASMFLQELPASAASRLWAAGICTSVGLRDAVGTSNSQPSGASSAQAAPTDPQTPSSSNIPPRVESASISPAHSQAEAQDPQQPSVRTVTGGASPAESVPQGVQSQSSGSAPSPPGSRGRVASSTKPAGEPSGSDAVPAPRIAQVLGYAGELYLCSMSG